MNCDEYGQCADSVNTTSRKEGGDLTDVCQGATQAKREKEMMCGSRTKKWQSK